MSIWKIIVQVFLPVPLILLALLNVPLPRNIRRGLILFIDRALNQAFIFHFKLQHVALFITSLSFLQTSRATLDISFRNVDPSVIHPGQAAAVMGKKWRAERNFWLSFFCLTLWLLLIGFQRVVVENLRLKDALDSASGPPVLLERKKREVKREKPHAAEAVPDTHAKLQAAVADLGQAAERAGVAPFQGGVLETERQKDK